MKKQIMEKLAFQNAYQARFCPTSKQLESNPISEQTQKHIACCPACRDYVSMPVEQKDAWRTLMGKLASLIPAEIKATPAPGQMWSLDQNLATWDKRNRFCKPANVLILNVQGNAVRVAQLCGDELMMGEGDVSLGEFNGFAESWNIYTVHINTLERYYGQVEHEVIENVLSKSMEERAFTEEYSIPYFFRQMEIEIGSFVSIPSVFALMDEMHDSGN